MICQKWYITLILVIIYYLIPEVSFTQVKGKISDTQGDALSYATIYLEGTTIGTISNVDGEYELELKNNGNYSLIFQYVGYKKAKREIKYQGKSITLDIVLESDDNIISELIISANREDPAYAIIRKAIQKRNYYKTQVKSFEADLYTKGVVKITDAPKAILGEKIGDLNGILDTSRQGIVYLSESRSKFYFEEPNKTKEIMVSSVKSGDNSLFTANQFSWASFDLYSEYLNFSRSIVSPIADNALSHYKYRLEQAYLDENGFIINKIKIIPKSETAPLLNGYVYITEDQWNLYSADLLLYGAALKNTFLDTIEVKQVFVNLKKPDTWRLFSQVFQFKAGLLGFKMGGNFSYIFSNHELEKDVSVHFANNETFRVENDALKKDSSFWNEIRPIPLTFEEKRDYIRKDSLQRIWNTTNYMDSLDKVNNRFSLLKLLTGYNYNITKKNTVISFPSPLSTFRFNAVEGFKISINAILEKEDSTFRKWTIHPAVDYGFSDHLWKPRIALEYRFDNYNLGSIKFKAGRQNQQFEPREPITERNNTWSSLWEKVNNIRLYQHNFVNINFSKEVSNGLYFDVSTSFSDRRPLAINSQYSFRKKTLTYQENIPRQDLDLSVYSENKYWKNNIIVLIRPSQKYSSYPNVKIRDVSNWPNITLEYENGIPLDQQATFFHKLTFRIRDRYVNAHLLGFFSYNIEGGSILGKKPSYFGDFFHPMGNELQSPIDPDLSSFNLLPYYEYSTNRYYAQVNFRHHFNGYIFDKIPLINKTSLKFVLGFSALYEPYKGGYWEPIIGIENFRIGPFKLFDIEYALSFDKYGYRDHGILFRLSQLLNN